MILNILMKNQNYIIVVQIEIYWRRKEIYSAMMEYWLPPKGPLKMYHKSVLARQYLTSALHTIWQIKLS